jgi:hypothetical protein
MVAASLTVPTRREPILSVIGPGCDGELRPAEVLVRVAALGRAGAWTGTLGVTPEIADELDAAARVVPTEASRQVVRCARGETGRVSIRRGRRHVELGPVGGLAFFFDLRSAAAALPLARAVTESAGIEEGRQRLGALGVRTELDYEREHTDQ